jgi:hypothetical protein
VDYRSPGHARRFSLFLLRPVLAALRGQRSALESAWADIDRTHRWHFAQALWYDASYLTGRIDDSTFLAQPRALYAQEELTFYAALKADLEGRAGPALDGYRRCLQWPVMAASQIEIPGSLLRDAAVREFLAWRVEVLQP